MNKQILYSALIYFAVISLVCVVLTISDKKRAKKNKWRIKERTLLFFAFLGGALAEYITMKMVHHKTLHKKFMIGLPVMILVQIALVVLAILCYPHITQIIS